MAHPLSVIISDDSPQDRLARSFATTSGVVLLVTLVAVATAAALHAARLSDLRTHAVTVVALTSGVFLVAATLRMAVYVLTRHTEDRARAGATALVAIAVMPVHLATHSFVEPEAASVDALAALGALRMLSAVAAITLLLLAVARPHPSARHCLLATSAATTALGLLATGSSAAWWPDVMPQTLQGLSLVTALLWGAAAGYTAHRTDARPWATGMAPCLLLMGMTEVLVAIDPRVPGVGTTAAAILMALLSVIAVARGLEDLRSVVAEERRRSDHLERDLLAARDDLAALQLRERHLAHDARGTLAGVRAAMQIWANAPAADLAARTGGDDPTGPLRASALTEVARLEDALRQHRIQLGCGPVALDDVVERVRRAACGRGAEIVVDVPRLVVLGQATDLEIALREVLGSALAAHPSGRQLVEGWRRHDDVAVVEVAVGSRRGRLQVVSDSDGTVGADGRGLDHARLLMRRQGGDLEIDGGAVRLTMPLYLPWSAPAALLPQQRRPSAAH